MPNTSLRYFVAVARHGSFREASVRLHVAQSALSRQIRNLEQSFEVPLFERHARGVRMTPAGEIFLRHARDALHQDERIQSELEALKGLRRGHVRVHSIESLVGDLLSRALARFRNRYPGVTADVTIEGTDRVIAAVREGRADIGLVFYPQRDPDIQTVSRIVEPLSALMRPDHPLADARQLSLADAIQHPLALPPAPSGSRMLIDAASKAAGLHLRPVLESNSIQLLVRFVAESGGLTILSRLSASGNLQGGELIATPMRDRLLRTATIELLTLAGRTLPVAAAEFLRQISADLAQLSLIPPGSPPPATARQRKRFFDQNFSGIP